VRIAVAIIAIFVTRFLMDAWFYAGHDGDLVWQDWLGSFILHAHHLPAHLGHETFTADGARWVPQEWAFSVAVAWLNATGHFAVLAIATAAAAAGALLLTAYRSVRRGASYMATALVVTCTGFAMLQDFGVRAQVFGWLFLAIILLLLEIETVWIFLVIPIIALWANIHASALIAPVFVGAWWLGTWIEDRAWTPRVERNFVVAAGSVVAVYLTPLLWQLPIYALSLETSGIRSVIAEWQPPDIRYYGFFGGLLPLLASCCYFGIAAPRERWRDGMLFAVAALIAGIAVRHVPLAALVIAPMAAQRLTSIFPHNARASRIMKEPFSKALLYVSSALVCMIVVLDLAHEPKVSGVTLPRGAFATLASLPGTHNVYCEDFAWCSLALRSRNLRTFLDGRCDPFPANVWRDYLAIQRVSPGWDAILSRWNVDSVLLDKGDALAQAMALHRDWHLFYRQGRYEIFLHQSVATAER
jgi:hypothetical protein